MQPTNWKIKVDDQVFPHTHDNPEDPQFETVKVISPFAGWELGAWSAGPKPQRPSHSRGFRCVPKSMSHIGRSE